MLPKDVTYVLKFCSLKFSCQPTLSSHPILRYPNCIQNHLVLNVKRSQPKKIPFPKINVIYVSPIRLLCRTIIIIIGATLPTRLGYRPPPTIGCNFRQKAGDNSIGCSDEIENVNIAGSVDLTIFIMDVDPSRVG